MVHGDIISKIWFHHHDARKLNQAEVPLSEYKQIQIMDSYF